MNQNELDTLASDLFADWRAGDLHAVEQRFAADARVRIPAMGVDGTFAEVRPLLEGMLAPGRTHERLLRVVHEPDTVVDHHISRWTDPSGRRQSAETCAIIRFDPDGKVASMDELFDAGVAYDPRQAALDTVETHVRSEFTNDVPAIMETVSKKGVFFPLVAKQPDGQYAVELVTDTPGAWAFYAATREMWDAVSSLRLYGFTGDWYTMRASVGKLSLKDKAAPGHAGLEVENPSVVIFPVNDDGIGGEILWTKFQFADTVEAALAGRPLYPDSSDPATERQREYANAKTLSAWLKAWQRGDVDALDSLVAKQCCWISKVVTPELEELSTGSCTDRAEVLDRYAAAEAPVGLTIVQQGVTDWYGFVELRYGLPGRKVLHRMVAIYPFDEAGQLIGELSYVMEIAEDGGSDS